MYKIAICDDQLNEMQIIHNSAVKYFDFNKLEYKISHFNSAQLLLKEFDNNNFDILLLDICMPEFSGLDLAKELQTKQVNTKIVFLSNSCDYAIDAFEVNAVHYLTKPFTQEKFNEAIDRLLSIINKKRVHTFTLKIVGGGLNTVNMDDIIYIENFNHEQKIYMKGNRHIFARDSLTNIVSMLNENCPNQFISPYKGYIINLEYVETIQTSEISLCERHSVPIAKRTYRDISDLYFSYRFNK
ncbi:MAG: LytTR family DNA-binding domain-containing protein [Bacilli bacterium]|jgi:DNA-binding LytR/AlgR family response regulator|uniref:LytR/AlgR family response regulator transcription factor n=1 Tax=Anaerorhabdus sp. TaxID=1872524 RepID=UPI002FC729AA